jgi:hypothetical protein
VSKRRRRGNRRFLCAQALFANIAAEVENDQRELSQAHGVTPFHPLLKGSKALQEVGKEVAPTEGQGDEEGATLNVRGIYNDFRRCFFTILDNVLTVGDSAGKKQKAAWPHPHPGGLLK